MCHYKKGSQMASTALGVLSVKLAHRQQRYATAPLLGCVHRNIGYTVLGEGKGFKYSTVSSMEHYAKRKNNYCLDYFLPANRI